MNTLRKQGETFEEYKLRLYMYKDIYGITNNKIGTLLNEESGNDWDESAYRKPVESFFHILPHYMDINDTPSDIIDEMYEIKDTLYKETVKLRDQRRVKNSTLRDEARIESLYELIVENREPLEVPEFNRTYESNKDRIAVLQLSDWHIGEVFNSSLNTYNTEIAFERACKIAEECIEYCSLMQASKLIVLNQGDMIAGGIRNTARIQNSEDTIEQIQTVAEILSFIINIISESVEEVELITVTDNHGRLTPNYKEHIEKESFQLLLPWYMKADLRNNKRVKFLDSKVDGVEEYEIAEFKIFDEVAFVVHGHNDKVGNIIPDLSMLYGKKPIAVFMGHIHKNYEDEEYEVDLIVCPSLVGSGEFSKKIRRKSQPRQKLTIFENKDNETKRIATFMLNAE